MAERLPAGPGVNFLVRRALPLEERYYGNTALFTERQKRKLLRHDYRTVQPFDLARPYWRASGGLDPVTRMQGCDIHLWLAGDILLKADKMSMAHSLELRVPFLDREVFALARRLPPDAKADARQTKKALRAAAARHLPLPSAQRKKRGFPVPVRDWLRDPVYAPGCGSFRQSGGGAVLSGAAAAYPVRPALAAPAGQLAADLLHLLLSGLVWAIFWSDAA